MSINAMMSLTTVTAEISYGEGMAFLIMAYDKLPPIIRQISREHKFKDAFYDLWRNVILLAYNSRAHITHVHTDGHFLFRTEEFRSILRILRISHCPELSPCPVWEYRPAHKSSEAIFSPPTNSSMPPMLISINALHPNYVAPPQHLAPPQHSHNTSDLGRQT